jgi:hypothetical protein
MVEPLATIWIDHNQQLLPNLPRTFQCYHASKKIRSRGAILTTLVTAYTKSLANKASALVGSHAASTVALPVTRTVSST